MGAEIAAATNLLLTGQPGIGKTTAVQCLVELVPQVRLAGFVTVEIESSCAASSVTLLETTKVAGRWFGRRDSGSS